MPRTRALNTDCPWSGDPVSPEALTRYKDHIVGFCNPGCRDKFEAAINPFDEAIAALRPKAFRPPKAPDPLKPYRSRYFRSAPLINVDNMRLKTIIITQTENEEPELLARDAVERYLAAQLPKARRVEGADYGVGYVILHCGEVTDWLLTRWWARGDIGMGMLACRADDGEFHPLDDRYFIACVWDEAAIHFECNTWRDEAMKADGSVDNYLVRTIPDGWR